MSRVNHLCVETDVPGLFLVAVNGSYVSTSDYVYVMTFEGERIGIDLYFPKLARALRPSADKNATTAVASYYDVQTCGFYEARTEQLVASRENPGSMTEELRLALRVMKTKGIFDTHQQEAASKKRFFVTRNGEALQPESTRRVAPTEKQYVLRIAHKHERQVSEEWTTIVSL